MIIILLKSQEGTEKPEASRLSKKLKSQPWKESGGNNYNHQSKYIPTLKRLPVFKGPLGGNVFHLRLASEDFHQKVAPVAS